MHKKLFTATAIYSLAPQLPRIVSFFMLPVLTPHLTAYDYGINGILFAYIGILDAFKDLGLSLFIINSFYKYPKRYKIIWKRIFGFLQIWALVFGLLLLPILWWVIPEQEVQQIPLIAVFVILPIMFFDPVTLVGMKYFQLNEKPVSFITISIVASLSAILVNYVTIVHFKMGYLGLLAGQFAAKLIAFLIYAFLVFWQLKLYPSLQFSWHWLKKKLLVSAPMIPHFYAAYLLNISDRVMLDLFRIDLGKIGVYAFAYSIGTYFSILGKGMADAATPFMMKLYKDGSNAAEKQVRNMIWLLQGGLLLAAFFVCLWVKELFLFVARNEELRDSYQYAIPVIMAYTYYPMYYGSNAKLRFTEQIKSIWKISLVAGLVSLFLNLLMIPLLGIFGAAITTFIAYMFMGYRGYWLRDFRQINVLDYLQKYWLALTIVTAFSVYYLVEMSIIIKVLISTCLLLALVLNRKNIIKLIQ